MRKIKTDRVSITKVIHAPLSDVFEWFYFCENYKKSPIVFKSKWKNHLKGPIGSQRDIIMIAGWYMEEITDVKLNDYIQYKVITSIPKVQQDFTEIKFIQLSDNTTKVVWTIEIGVYMPLIPIATRIATSMAKMLYSSILRSGKKDIENENNKKF